MARSLNDRAAESSGAVDGDLIKPVQHCTPPLVACRRGALRRGDHVGEQHGAQGATLAMVERMSASPGMARATLEAVFRLDVRPILPTITAPTPVIHARDVVPVQEGRYIGPHPRGSVARS
jgi:hypothetical protein